MEAEGKVTGDTWPSCGCGNCTGTTVVTCKTGPGYEGKERPIEPGYNGRIGIDVKAVGGAGEADNHVQLVVEERPASLKCRILSRSARHRPNFGLTGSDAWFSMRMVRSTHRQDRIRLRLRSALG